MGHANDCWSLWNHYLNGPLCYLNSINPQELLECNFSLQYLCSRLWEFTENHQLSNKKIIVLMYHLFSELTNKIMAASKKNFCELQTERKKWSEFHFSFTVGEICSMRQWLFVWQMEITWQWIQEKWVQTYRNSNNCGLWHCKYSLSCKW